MKRKEFFRNLAMPIALIAIALYFWGVDRWAAPPGEFWQIKGTFLDPRNLTQLLIEFSIVATLALGMFMIILTGNIDLSVGSGVGLLGGVAAVLIFKAGWGAWPAMIAATATGLVLYTSMGALIVKQRIPSFIITLGGLLVFKGVFWRVIESSTIPITRGDDNAYSEITTYYLPKQVGLILAVAIALVFALMLWRSRSERSRHGLANPGWKNAGLRYGGAMAVVFAVVAACNGYSGVPLSLVVLAVCAIAVHFLTRHTPFGRYLYAIGGNEEAAVLSGISVDRVVIGAFLLMGLMTAVTGFMSTAYIGSSTTTVGDLMELDAIAACVIGGTALKGGRGTVWGVLMGALVMTALLNGMGLLGVDPWIKYVARGSVLALAVWMDVRFSRA